MFSIVVAFWNLLVFSPCFSGMISFSFFSAVLQYK